MSIQNVETDPRSDDRVLITDPAAEPPSTEPNPGTDHADPNGIAITHVRQNQGRHLISGFVDEVKERFGSDDPDAAFTKKNRGKLTSGTEERSDRWVHDEALQVRQLVPTQMSVGNYTIAANGVIQMVPERAERMTIVIQAVGGPIYVGTGPGNANSSAGFQLPSLATLHLSAIGAIWIGAGPAGGQVSFVEQFRTDNEVS